MAVLGLGLFHYTPYFELAPRFEWVASAPVIAVLAVLAVVEIWADANPEIGEYADLAAYLPKMVAGFIALSAATGSVDSNLLQLGASGIMGSATALTVQFLREKVSNVVREFGEDTDASLSKGYSYGETGAFGGLLASSVLVPVVVPIALLILAVGGLVIYRRLQSRTKDCIFDDCDATLHPKASTCATCKRDQNEAAAHAVNEQVEASGASEPEPTDVEVSESPAADDGEPAEAADTGTGDSPQP